MGTYATDVRLDCLGLFCPMPIMKTREAMRLMRVGQTLELLSDDPACDADMKAWATRSGHDLLEIDKDGTVYRFVVRKAR